MKEFIKGKWYKRPYHEKDYFKYSHSRDEGSYFSRFYTEKIENGKYIKLHKDDYWANSDFDKKMAGNPIPLSEIQQYLPDGHVDKISESWCVKVTEENREVVRKWMPHNGDGWIFDVGSYFGITTNGVDKAGYINAIYFSKVISTKDFYKKIGHVEEVVKRKRTIKKKPPTKCKYLHIFGEDVDNYDDCDDCGAWYACYDENERIKSNNKLSTNKLKLENNEGQSIKIKRIVSNVSRGDRPRGIGFFDRRSVTASRCGHNSYKKKSIEC